MTRRQIEIQTLIDERIKELAIELTNEHAVDVPRFVRELHAGLERYSDRAIYKGYATVNEAHPPN